MSISSSSHAGVRSHYLNRQIYHALAVANGYRHRGRWMVNTITQVYASWSQHLNRQIYHALAIANGYATEALGNIRTVKAFAAEKLETNKYDVAIATALQKGIIDAFGGAGERVVFIPPFISPHYETYLHHAILIETGIYMINSYLDLGDGVSLVRGCCSHVLILWFGGWLCVTRSRIVL